MVDTTSLDDKFYSIIPAGGVGSRLWPLSRAVEPKFLLDIVGTGHSLLRATWDRLVPLSGENRTVVVTGSAHQKAVVRQLPELPVANLVLEPGQKDSTAAICLAAAIILLRDPEAVVGSFPADHFIEDDEEFCRTIRAAIAAASTGRIVTIGITPTEPSTAFGYIKTDGPLEGANGTGASHVARFVEKPSKTVAEEYLADGGYFWNAGMFIAKASVLLERLEASEPELAASINEIAQAWGTAEQDEVQARLWDGLKKVAIDYSIAEPSAEVGMVGVVPGDFGWDDVGDFSALARHAAEDGSGSLTVLGDATRVLSDSSSGIVAAGSNRLIATIGVEDIVVIDTPDALLVTTTHHAQKVKAMVDQVKRTGNENLL